MLTMQPILSMAPTTFGSAVTMINCTVACYLSSCACRKGTPAVTPITNLGSLWQRCQLRAEVLLSLQASEVSNITHQQWPVTMKSADAPAVPGIVARHQLIQLSLDSDDPAAEHRIDSCPMG